MRVVAQVGGFKQIRVYQALRRDDEGIAGEGREAGVRRIAIAGGDERQYLPELLLAGVEEVEQEDRGGSEVAHAVWTGQRGGVEQQTTGARPFHVRVSNLCETVRGAPRSYRERW